MSRCTWTSPSDLVLDTHNTMIRCPLIGTSGRELARRPVTERNEHFAACAYATYITQSALRLEAGLPNAWRRYRASLNPGVAAPFESGRAPGSPLMMSGLPKTAQPGPNHSTATTRIAA